MKEFDKKNCGETFRGIKAKSICDNDAPFLFRNE
jgi:hypothetical protein